MSAATIRAVYAVPSAGRTLILDSDERLGEWWPAIAPHVAGATGALARVPTDTPADLRLRGVSGPGDTRRLINAHLHRLHLGHDTLCVHAAALHCPGHGGAVVLLGGHGAGKTLVGIALALRGWRSLAGDTTLLDIGRQGEVAVRGGSRAFLARRQSARRWFPELRLASSGADKIDLGGCRNEHPGRSATEPVPVVAAVLVHVDGDPRARTEIVEQMGRHSVASVWLLSSGHLLDRVLNDSDIALRLIEDESAAQRRLDLVRVLAARLPVHAAWGPPKEIASAVEQITAARKRGKAQKW